MPLEAVPVLFWCVRVSLRDTYIIIAIEASHYLHFHGRVEERLHEHHVLRSGEVDAVCAVVIRLEELKKGFVVEVSNSLCIYMSI